MFDFLFKKKYTYVRPCPRCGNAKTGHVVCYMQRDSLRMIYNSLLNGELIETSSEARPEQNLFCSNCGCRWSGDVEIKYLTVEEIEQQKKLRGITKEMIETFNIPEMSRLERKIRAYIFKKKALKNLDPNVKKSKSKSAEEDSEENINNNFSEEKPQIQQKQAKKSKNKEIKVKIKGESIK